MLQSVTLINWIQVCGHCSTDAIFTQDDTQQGQHFADFRLVSWPSLCPSTMFRMVHVMILLLLDSTNAIETTVLNHIIRI